MKDYEERKKEIFLGKRKKILRRFLKNGLHDDLFKDNKENLKILKRIFKEGGVFTL